MLVKVNMYLHLSSGISFVGDHTSNALSFINSGFLSGEGISSGQTAW